MDVGEDMKLSEYVNTREFSSRVGQSFPTATSAPLHKIANLRNPGVELDISQAVYNLAKTAYIHRKEYSLIHNGLVNLQEL